jgi:hypothetical protein
MMSRIVNAVLQWGQPNQEQEFEFELGPDETLIDWTRVRMWHSRAGKGWAKFALTNRRVIVRYYPGYGPPLLATEQHQELEVPLADVVSVHMEKLSWNPGRIVLRLRDGRERGFQMMDQRGQVPEPKKWLALLQGRINGPNAPA